MGGKTRFSHVTPGGAARMVSVAGKAATHRTARAEACVNVGTDIARRLRRDGGLAKGSVIETARIAGILAAKRTSELVPMCHPLMLDCIEVDMTVLADRVRIETCVSCIGPTGAEMEAMTAAGIAALTVYDMVKSAGKGIEIGPIRLLEKNGGKSGRWCAPAVESSRSPRGQSR